jgi:(p)ppGpp synthase/HD superfamily hydrolase
MDLVLRAISYAARCHQGQLRKDGETPYVAHPMRVLAILSQVFGVNDPETLATAALHDTIEDTTADRDELIELFGERVARHVALLSKDKRLPEADRERSYLDQLAEAPSEVKLCKLGDTYDNLVDSAGLDASARAEKIRKAKTVVDRVADGLPDTAQHALEQVQNQIRHAASLLPRST